MPFLYAKEKRLFFCGVLSFWFMFFYGVPNHFSPFSPLIVPETEFDHVVSFQPAMIWIYISTYVYMFVMYFLLKKEDNLNKVLYSYTATVFIGSVIFFFFPTEIPRLGYPLPDNLSPLTRFAFESLRAIDNSTNAVPSLHVGLSVLGALVMWDETRLGGMLASIWAVAIIYSTMAVKQHHFIDVSTGALLGLSTYWLFHRQSRYSMDFLAQKKSII